MFYKKVSKITHLRDAPPLLCPLKCLTRPGVRHITPLLGGARSSSSMAKQPQPFLFLPLSTNVVEAVVGSIESSPYPQRW
jgi:hypothetical protein